MYIEVKTGGRPGDNMEKHVCIKCKNKPITQLQNGISNHEQV